MLFGDFLNPGNCFKLALVPIPGMIRLPESAEFRRKATLVGRIAVLVLAAQKPPGKRIERNHLHKDSLPLVRKRLLSPKTD